MSVATQISRIQKDRNTIRTKLVELGMAQNTDDLDKLAAAISGIVDQGAVSATVQEGDTYTIPKGYHNGSGTVSGVAGGGSYSLQSKTVTPTKSQQNVTPDNGYYGLSDVTVGAADVLTGKVIVDAAGKSVAGSMPNNGRLQLTIDGLTATSVAIPVGHSSDGSVVSLTSDIEDALAAI